MKIPTRPVQLVPRNWLHKIQSIISPMVMEDMFLNIFQDIHVVF